MADVSRAHARLLHGLRDHGMAYAELGRRLGARMGLHTTDAAALVEILEAADRGRPLTQVELSHRVGLTPGATSALLNRLESAGHVVRARESADRRRVTLHPTAGVDERVDEFFDPLSRRVETLLATFTPAALAEVERFVTDYVALMQEHVRES